MFSSKYNKKIKKIVFKTSSELAIKSNIGFIKTIFFKNFFWILFKKEKMLKHLSTCFYFFNYKENKNNEKNIEETIKSFIIYFFLKFIIQKKNKKIIFIKKIILPLKEVLIMKIKVFFEKHGLKLEDEIIPNFDIKTIINWKKFIIKKIYIYSNFFKLFVKIIDNYENKEESLKHGYKLGFSLAMCVHSNLEREKYEFKFLKRFTVNQKKTELFFVKLYFWTDLISTLRFFEPFKYNVFICLFNKQLKN